MRIHIYNIRSYISEIPPGLDDELSCYHENYFFSTKFKLGQWDGKTHFLYKKSIPTGLLYQTLNYLRKNKIEYQVIDHREVPLGKVRKVTKNFLNEIELRPEQLVAADTAIARSRGIIKMATGTGKTEVAIAITKALNLKTLFLVNSRTLLYQTKERYLKRMPELNEKDVGLWGDGHREHGKIVVATAQSFDALKKSSSTDFAASLEPFKCLIMDECHHSSAKTWYQVAMCCDAYYRFGFSGTPLDRTRLSNMKLTAALGRVIYELTTASAISKEMLCPISMKMIPIEKTFHFPKYSTVYMNGIVKCDARNNKVVSTAIDQFKQNKKVLILVRYLEHGQRLYDVLKKSDYPVIWLNGKHSQLEREAQLQNFIDKNTILIGSGIFDEGVDIPAINCLIIAAGGKSDVKTIQRIGRGLRKKSDGSILEAFDFLDASKYLCEHSRQRMKIYEREGYL
jgi:superfamily II DNA or RNA helicase